MRNRVMLIVAALVVALSASVGGATAAGVIKSKDIKDHTIKAKDLKPGLVTQLDQSASSAAQEKKIAALETKVAALQAQAAASAVEVAAWTTNPGTVIASPTTVQMTKAAADGTSL